MDSCVPRNATPARGVPVRVTEQQEYRIVSRFGDVELRHYEPCVIASIDVRGSIEQAGSTAFRPLVSYISGANRSGAKLAMTAPVMQEQLEQQQGERLAMTAPVLQEPAADADSWTVSFVLPGSRPIEEYPEPTDARVRLQAEAAHEAASLRWSGRWSAGNVAKRTAELQRVMAEQGWVAAGSPRWARYDPPWKPAFARRNEILVRVTRAVADSATPVPN